MKGFAMIAAILCLATLAAADRNLQSVTTSAQTSQVSILWAAVNGTGSEDIPMTDPRLTATNGPEQVHLTYVNSTSVAVSWATGNATAVASPITLGAVSNPYGNLSTVNITEGASYPVAYGTSSSSLTSKATGTLITYAQIYTGFVNGTGFANNNPTNNYTSPSLHHVVLTGLTPNKTYFYQVSGENGAVSTVFNFTTPPAVGSFPMTMGVFADIGQTYNSSATLDRMLESDPEVLVLVGDWTYADDWTANGTSLVIGYPNNTFTNDSIPSPSGSYQPRWDSYFRLAQPLLSHISTIPNAGNHELEPQDNGQYFKTNKWGLDNGRQFNSYLSRLPVTPLYENSDGAPLYFSTNVGPVHVITLNNYEDFLVNSPQFDWLQKDLASIDRSVTPWVVAHWHAPWYSSYTTHYKETESMRVTMEPLFYAAGVDIVLNGHLHEYERTHAVYNYEVTNCGTVHIIMGDGGNVEGLYTTFIDEPPVAKNCPKAGPSALPNYQPGPWTPSFVYPGGTNNGYCPTSQPQWSAFRQPAFGHGVLTFINETTALWEWNRDEDGSDSVFADSVYLIRDRTCFNYLGNGPALAPLLAPSASNLLNASTPAVSVSTAGSS